MLRPIFSLLFTGLLLWAAVRSSALPPDDGSGDNSVTGVAGRVLAALSAELRKKAQFDFDDAERKDWSNLPAGIYARKGVSLGEMDDAARKATHELLRRSLSSQGYMKAAAVVHREDILLQTSGNAKASQMFGTGRYFFDVFGQPGVDKSWGWQFDGHHLALNFTIVNGVMTGAPALWGAQPDEIQTGPEAGWRVFAAERAKGFALVGALNDAQRKRAVLSQELPKDLFTGPQRDKALQTMEGLPASAMNPSQQGLLWTLIDEYVNNQSAETALAHRRKIEREGIGKVHFAWMGPVDTGRSVYYRVHGPSILIEYDNTGAGRDGRDSNHIHAMFRDPSNDYGEDLLKKHYQAAPHGQSR